LKRKTTKRITIIFIMNLSINRIIFIKTGLLLLVILFFLGCKKENNEIGLSDPDRLPTNTHYTDTLTIKSEVVLIDSFINTTNVSSSTTNSLMLVGAYTDPILGPIASEAYTRIKLVKEFIELPAATADSAFLELKYKYFYGDTLQTQIINVYKLIDPIAHNTKYYTTSPALNYDPTPIGSITFNATKHGNGNRILKIKVTDIPFLQSILDASKSNNKFFKDIPGIAFIPGNTTTGTIIRINSDIESSSFNIYYTQFSENKIYRLNLGRGARKFYRIIADRSSTSIASLNNNYQAIRTGLIGNECYVQSFSGLRTRITIPYLYKLKEAYPNMNIISASLKIKATSGSLPDKYKPNTGLVLIRTQDNGVIKKDSKGTVFYVQPDDQSQILNQSVQIHYPTDHVYTFSIRSYLQAALLGQIENDPIIISPSLLYREANRVVFYDNNIIHSVNDRMKVKIYFTTTK
jgi:hypothetical protein